MKTEYQTQQADSQLSTDVDTRKSWVTPVVSESPVNEFTAAGFTGVGADNTWYS